MSNPQLLNYINQQLANGVSQEKIKSDLLSAGWHAYELEDAFRSVEPSGQEPLRQVASQPDGQLGSQSAAEPLTTDLNNQSASAGIPTEQIAPVAEANPIDTSLPVAQGQRLAKDDLYKDVLGPVYSQKSAPQLKPLKTPIEIILLPIAAVLLLIGGGVFAYFHYFRGSDQIARIMEMSNKVVLAMAEVRSASYEMLINIEIDPATMPEMGTGFNGAAMPIPLQGPLMGIGEGMSKMEVNLSGNFDVRNANRPEGSLEVTISANDGPQVFGMEARLTQDVLYLFLSHLPDIGMPLGFLKNQWVQIPLGEMEQARDIFQMEEEARTLREMLLTPQKMYPEQVRRMHQITRELFEVRKFARENVDGVNMYHIILAPDEEAFIRFIPELQTILYLTEEESRSFVESLQTIDITEMQFWVGVDDSLLYGLLAKSNYIATEYSPAGSMTFSLQLRDHNRAINVDVPSPVIGVEEIMARFFGGAEGFPGMMPQQGFEMQGGGRFEGPTIEWEFQTR